MKTANDVKATLFTIMALSLISITSPALTSTATADELGAAEPRGKCPYSLQLQKSVEAQQAYLVKVARAKASNPIPEPEQLAATTVEAAEMTEHLSVAWVSFTWGSRIQ